MFTISHVTPTLVKESERGITAPEACLLICHRFNPHLKVPHLEVTHLKPQVAAH